MSSLGLCLKYQSEAAVNLYMVYMKIKWGPKITYITEVLTRSEDLDKCLKWKFPTIIHPCGFIVVIHYVC